MAHGFSTAIPTVRQAMPSTPCAASKASPRSRHLILADEPVIRDRVAHRLVCQSCGGVFRAGLHVPILRPHAPLSRPLAAAPMTTSTPLPTARRISHQDNPVIDYYQSRGLLHTIDGNRDIESFSPISPLHSSLHPQHRPYKPHRP